MNDTCTPVQLESLLQHQVELLSELIQFGGEQQDAIEAGRVSELLSVLARKQPFLEQLGHVRQQLQDWREEIESGHFWSDTQCQIRCQHLRDRAAVAFKTLIESEQACETALTASRDQIQIRLQHVDSGRNAANAYQSQATAPPTSRVDFSSMG